ncbi:interleukin-4 receptor subunit alpha [Perognathus longimembris pacificus]|uniref:interleukin-4 receptor subunit alpha n=1 Tax=Perognathus longimembris pacificus TaxID=214514 RepID=UPI002019462F|nr:interleukin-4 receptor subunit alpha [Perognathus longimembris pacificus]
MGQLRAAALFPVTCLVLAWVAGSGCLNILYPPTCFSDYLRVSTCEWSLDRPLNCTAELRLAYWINLEFFENQTCVPDNVAESVCVCHMSTEDLYVYDSYQLDLWAGQRLLWGGAFTPSQHVKPMAPENLTVRASSSHSWVLAWSNPYPSENFLYNKLTYLVNVSQKDDPAQFQIYNVTYTGPVLRLVASALKPGLSYSARVRARASILLSTWSEWSPSVIWNNHSQLSLEQQLPLGMAITCLLILFVCLAGYLGVTRVKKLWWDQIPSPARSSVLAVVIRDSQVSLWEKSAPGQEAAERPHWKTCLAKLLPCLLEPGMNMNPSVPRGSGRGPRPTRLAWSPMEMHRRVLCPESTSVVRCVELCEAPALRGEAEAEEEEEARDPRPAQASADAFPEDMVARLAESLFLDMLGAEDRGSAAAGRPLPTGSVAVPGPPAGQALTPVPLVVADNPAYRSFSDCCQPSAGPGAAQPGVQVAAGPEQGNPADPGPPQTEPESWEQILRQRVLQMAAAIDTGYRDFTQAVEQGARGLGADGGGYKALSGVPALDAACTPGACSVGGGYKPFQSLSSCPGAPASPLTFALDVEPPQGTQVALVPHPACLGPGKHGQKPPAAPGFPLDDLGSGIVYSALTCHLCGRLKQRCSPTEHGQGTGAARPCCDCCSGDPASPPGSPPPPSGTPEDGKALLAHSGSPCMGVA